MDSDVIPFLAWNRRSAPVWGNAWHAFFLGRERRIALGQFDQLLAEEEPFGAAPEAAGVMQSARAHLSHRLTINGAVADEQLVLHWTFSTELYRSQTISHLAETFVEALRALIAHCQQPEAGGYTPSDFPRVRLTQPQLDHVLHSVSQTTDKAAKARIEDIYLLAPMQQGILFHSLYAPEAGFYCEQISIKFTGAIRAEVFTHAWQMLVACHAVLRTSFFWEQLDAPLQVVLRDVKVKLIELDWRDVSGEENAARLEAYLLADRRRGFVLSEAPLMRLALIRLAEETYQWIWSFHHLLLDGWSLPLILKDVIALYEALSQGQAIELPASRPYSDYVAWLLRQDLGLAQSFWRRTLGGFSTPTPLGADRTVPRILNEADAFTSQRYQLPEAATGALQELARQHQLTLNTLFQGAWVLLLSRYSGEQDIVFGATVSGRPAELPGVETMIGLFINTLPVRVHVRWQQALVEWLLALQEQQVELRQYEYSPLTQVQAWSDVPRGTPLFESLLVFENFPVDPTALRQSEDQPSIGDVRAIKRVNYPLMLVVAPGKQLSFEIDYDRRRFDADAITRMGKHLQTLLCAFATHQQRRLIDLPLLTAAEERHLLVDLNRTAVAYPQRDCLHELFEAQVARTPDALALVFDGRPTTNDQRPTTTARGLRSGVWGLGSGERDPQSSVLSPQSSVPLVLQL